MRVIEQNNIITKKMKVFGQIDNKDWMINNKPIINNDDWTWLDCCKSDDWLTVDPVKIDDISDKKQYEDLIYKYSRKIHKCDNKWCIRMNIAFHNMKIYQILCKKLNDYELKTLCEKLNNELLFS